MSKATFVRKIDGWRGDAALYAIEDAEHDYVIVSAVDLYSSGLMPQGYRTSETMVFPATADGETVDMLEIGFVPYKSHVDALEDAGFSVS